MSRRAGRLIGIVNRAVKSVFSDEPSRSGMFHGITEDQRLPYLTHPAMAYSV